MKKDKDWRSCVYNPQLDRDLVTVLCNRFRDRYRFLGGKEITRFIVEDILEVVEQYRRPLPEVKKGQIVWDGVEVDQSKGYGLSMKETRTKPIVLTLISKEDIEHRRDGMNARELRKLVTERLHNEAIEQGAVLNHIDGSLLMGYSPATIGKYIKELEEEKDIQIPDRGKIHDLGKGVTHKKEIVRYMLQHYTQPEIKRRTNHSGEAVDRYLRDYHRVKTLQGEHSPEEIAFATGLSVSLTKEYLDLIEELEGKGGKSS